MMCYRDRTFCPFWTDCRLGSDCTRALTQEVKEAAYKWWGGEDAPICVYVEKPKCWRTE